MQEVSGSSPLVPTNKQKGDLRVALFLNSASTKLLANSESRDQRCIGGYLFASEQR